LTVFLYFSGKVLDVSNGISLLSLKHHILLSYLQSLVLVAARRTLGDSLTARTVPPQSFSSIDRGVRGNNSGDLIDTIIEHRIVLEKIELLESKMRYQIEKLVRIADEPAQKTDGRLFPICHELALIFFIRPPGFQAKSYVSGPH